MSAPPGHDEGASMFRNRELLIDLPPDPSEYWPRRSDERREACVDLVERYYRQFRYGCQNEECFTPTCLTFRARRKSEAPQRAPTALSARAMATFVAISDYPYSKLCPFVTVPSDVAEDLAFPSDLRRVPRHRSRRSHKPPNFEYDVNPQVESFLRKQLRFIAENAGDGGKTDVSKQFSPSAEQEAVLEAASALAKRTKENEALAVKIDHKSLLQNLFNTSTWKYGKAVEIQLDKYRSIGSLANCVDQFGQEPKERTPKTPVFAMQMEDVRKPGANLLMDAADGLPLKIPTQPDTRSYQILKRLDGNAVLLDLPSITTEKDAKMLQLSRRTTPFGTVPLDINSGSDPIIGQVFWKRTVDYVLSNPSALVRSFRRGDPSGNTIKTEGIEDMNFSFALLMSNESNRVSILPCLWEALGAAYPKSTQMVSQEGSQTNLSDEEAAHFINIALAALISHVTHYEGSIYEVGSLSDWEAFRSLRENGHFFPSKNASYTVRSTAVAFGAAFTNGHALRLMRSVLRVFAARSFSAGSKSTKGKSVFVARILDFLDSDSYFHERKPGRQIPFVQVVLEWCRVILQYSWNGTPRFYWASEFGSAVEFLRVLYENREFLHLEHDHFQNPYLFRRLDFFEVAKKWLSFKPAGNQSHLLSWPWLFTRASIISFARVLNHTSMFRAVHSAYSLRSLVQRHTPLVNGHDQQVFDRLSTQLGHFLVLEIRRKKILEDALNGLWRRQKQELKRPLKIRMGMHEGEEGVDMGGVQQEFFRLALRHALDPDYGLFTSDSQTNMSWFLPCSKAPNHQFVLVGLLVGLALYNGVTLSVNFPDALYRKLLGLPVSSVDHIKDAWPNLAKGFQALLEYEGDDVEDVFMLSYMFNFEANGEMFYVDMLKESKTKPWNPDADAKDKYSLVDEHTDEIPDGEIDSKESPEKAERAESVPTRRTGQTNAVTEDAAMVTNANRAQYIRDYIFWLTHKSVEAQYDAFATGFFLAMDHRPLRLFNPFTLKELVEGFKDVDIAALEQTAAYENGFSRNHPTIVNFWKVVRDFTPEEARTLLEFVTASNRIPAKGIQEIAFIIQRNGSSNERLPTSLTCFGRLLLPEYTTREILETKLRAAIENSLGFGIA